MKKIYTFEIYFWWLQNGTMSKNIIKWMSSKGRLQSTLCTWWCCCCWLRLVMMVEIEDGGMPYLQYWTIYCAWWCCWLWLVMMVKLVVNIDGEFGSSKTEVEFEDGALPYMLARNIEQFFTLWHFNLKMHNQDCFPLCDWYGDDDQKSFCWMMMRIECPIGHDEWL